MVVEYILLIVPGSVLVFFSLYFMLSSIQSSRSDPIDSRNKFLITIYYLILSATWWISGMIFITKGH